MQTLPAERSGLEERHGGRPRRSVVEKVEGATGSSLRRWMRWFGDDARGARTCRYAGARANALDRIEFVGIRATHRVPDSIAHNAFLAHLWSLETQAAASSEPSQELQATLSSCLSQLTARPHADRALRPLPSIRACSSLSIRACSSLSVQRSIATGLGRAQYARRRWEKHAPPRAERKRRRVLVVATSTHCAAQCTSPVVATG
jgi:hypothetical protein